MKGVEGQDELAFLRASVQRLPTVGISKKTEAVSGLLPDRAHRRQPSRYYAEPTKVFRLSSGGGTGRLVSCRSSQMMLSSSLPAGHRGRVVCCGDISLTIRNKLYALATKYPANPVRSTPRYRARRNPPPVLIQPKISSTCLRIFWLIL